MPYANLTKQEGYNKRRKLETPAEYIARRKAEKAQYADFSELPEDEPAPPLAPAAPAKRAYTKRALKKAEPAPTPSFYAPYITDITAITILQKITPAEIHFFKTVQKLFIGKKHTGIVTAITNISWVCQKVANRLNLQIRVSVVDRIVSIMREGTRSRFAIISGLDDAYTARVGNYNEQLFPPISTPAQNE